MIDPFVSADWLQKHRDEVVVADVRWYLDGRSGRAAYESGHVPGAVFVDLDTALAGEHSAEAGRHPLPSPDRFASAMSALGIANDSIVVAYDDEGGVIAARLVWMLRAVGTQATVLDGGISAYRGELQGGSEERPAAVFAARSWPAARLATIDELASEDVVVIDARNADRYRGDFEPVDPRAGHVPGARSVPCRMNLESDGRLLPADELRARFSDAGVTENADVISYCGSGVTACHNLLSLELAGFSGARLFPGSWSQYSRSNRPVAVGSAPA